MCQETERLSFRLESADKNTIFKDGYTSVHGVATDIDFGRQRLSIMPERTSAGRIQRDHVRFRSGEVHDAVHHQRSRFHAVRSRKLCDPCKLKGLRVGPIDLVERAVPPTPVRTRVSEPVLRFTFRL